MGHLLHPAERTQALPVGPIHPDLVPLPHTPDFLHAALDTTVCAAFSKESRAVRVAGKSEISTQRYVARYNIAVIYAWLKEKGAAFDCLDRAYNDRSYLLPVSLNTNSRLDSLRSDPRVDELRRKMKLQPPPGHAG
jgi:hypothetical protein